MLITTADRIPYSEVTPKSVYRQSSEVFGWCCGWCRRNRNKANDEMARSPNRSGKYEIRQSCEKPVFDRGSPNAIQDGNHL